MPQQTKIPWPPELTPVRASLPSQAASLMDQNLPWGSQTDRASAVLFLLIPSTSPTNPAELLLTRRSTAVRTHKGQVGLAGGRREKEDLSPHDTAVREAFEELGIPKNSILTVGLLPSFVGLDHNPILPVLAFSPLSISDLTPDPNEVAGIFSVPWSLLTREHAETFKFNLFGHWRTSDLYRTPKSAIWGITARIIKTADLA